MTEPKIGIEHNRIYVHTSISMGLSTLDVFEERKNNTMLPTKDEPIKTK